MPRIRCIRTITEQAHCPPIVCGTLLVASLLHGSTASAQGAADTISPTREWQTSSPEDEGYYAPYTPDIPHAIHSSTKAIIGALIAIARKDGLLDRLDHPMLDFSSGRDIANVAIDSVPGG
jgi:hypothetical protein